MKLSRNDVSVRPRLSAVPSELFRLRSAMAVLLFCLVSSAPAASLNIDDQLQLADGLYDRDMYEMAIREYQFALDSATNHPKADEITYRIGECYRRKKDLLKAVGYYCLVENNYPSSQYRFKSALRRAEMLAVEGRNDDLLALLSSILAAQPPPELAASALYLTGSALGKSGKKAEAVAVYERIIRDYAGTSFRSYAMLELGGLRAAETDGQARAEELFQAIATNEASARLSAEAWFQLGGIYFRRKSYAQSAGAFAKLFQLYPADSRVAEARLPRAWALFYSQLPADALRLATEATAAAVPAENSGSLEEWFYLKANCLRQLMKPAEAAQVYTELLSKFPTGRYAGPAAYENVVSLYKAGRFQDAIDNAKALNPEPAIRKDLYWLMAESCMAIKDEAGSIQYYRLVLEQFPDSDLAPDAGYRLGHLLQKRGEYLQAADVFGNVASRYSSSEIAAQALFASAICRGKGGKNEEAVRDWGAVCLKYPASPLVEEALYQKAMGEVSLRRDEQATATLRDLLGRNAATRFAADSRYWLGVLLDGSAKSQDAEKELRKALDLKPNADLEKRIQFQLALVLQKTGKPDESASLLTPLVSSPVGGKIPSSLLSWLSEYQLSKRELGKALEAAILLSDNGESDSWKQTGFCFAGRVFVEQGKTNEARVVLEKALAIPGNLECRPESAWRLGEIEFRAKEYVNARKHFEEAARLASDDKALTIRVRSYAGIGRVLKEQGSAAEAVKYFMSVAVLFDDPVLVPECLSEAGGILNVLGRNEESAKAFKELADRYPESRLNKQQPR